MRVVLYTTHCPKCSILEKKLTQKNIEYTECTDIHEMKSKGISAVPWLEVDGEMLDFVAGNRWINEQE